jgi:hypothetical protein
MYMQAYMQQSTYTSIRVARRTAPPQPAALVGSQGSRLMLSLGGEARDDDLSIP